MELVYWNSPGFHIFLSIVSAGFVIVGAHALRSIAYLPLDKQMHVWMTKPTFDWHLLVANKQIQLKVYPAPTFMSGHSLAKWVLLREVTSMSYIISSWVMLADLLSVRLSMSSSIPQGNINAVLYTSHSLYFDHRVGWSPSCSKLAGQKMEQALFRILFSPSPRSERAALSLEMAALTYGQDTNDIVSIMSSHHIHATVCSDLSLGPPNSILYLPLLPLPHHCRTWCEPSRAMMWWWCFGTGLCYASTAVCLIPLLASYPVTSKLWRKKGKAYKSFMLLRSLSMV